MALIDLKGTVVAFADRFGDKIGEEGKAMLQMLLSFADKESDEIQAAAERQIQVAEERMQAMLTQILAELRASEERLIAYVDSHKLRVTFESAPKDYGPAVPK